MQGAKAGRMATAVEVIELVQKMHQMRGELFATVLNLSEEAAEVRRPELDGEDGWSVKDILAHLRMMDPSYRRFVLDALGHDASSISAHVREASVAPPAGAPHYLETSHGLSVLDLVRAMERERGITMELIAGLTLHQFELLSGSHPSFNELTVMQWLRSYYRHDRQHVAQIKGVPSDYAPRYASGKEPDQRLKRR